MQDPETNIDWAQEKRDAEELEDTKNYLNFIAGHPGCDYNDYQAWKEAYYEAWKQAFLQWDQEWKLQRQAKREEEAKKEPEPAEPDWI